MQRKPNITWRNSDTKKLEHQIKNFNAKVYYQRKKHPDVADILPQPIHKSDKLAMMEDLKQGTRKDFNKALNRLDRFSKSGAEKIVENKAGFKTTVWEVKEYDKIGINNINRDRESEREKYNLSRPNMQMGTIKQNELNDKTSKFDKVRYKNEWEDAKRVIDKELRENYKYEKVEQYKKDYLNMIDMHLGSYGDDVYNFISKIPADVLYDMYWEDDEVLKLGFVYDAHDADIVADQIIESWRNHLGLEDDENYDDLDD
jgi:hypothetical protein